MIVRQCATCARAMVITQLGQADCPQCELVAKWPSFAEDLRDEMIADANIAIQDRIEFYDEQLDLIKTAIDDNDLDLAREHIAEAEAAPKLRKREQDRRFLHAADYKAEL